jgi:hypothetical protein
MLSESGFAGLKNFQANIVENCEKRRVEATNDSINLIFDSAFTIIKS